MISIEALLLFAILICVVFLTVCMVVGIVFLVRYYSTFKKLEGQLELLGKNLTDSLSPAVKEIHDTAASIRGLIEITQDSVAEYATLSMIKKVSPKLAGLKLGLDLGMKAYNSLLATNGTAKNTKRLNYLEILKKFLERNCC